MYKKQIILGLVVVFLAIFAVLLWNATKKVRDGYNLAYDVKLLDLCEMQMESLGRLFDVYQAGHNGKFPSDMHLLFSDPNVIKTKWIAGVSGIGTGKRYRTRQDRLKDLLQCPSETASYDMSCVYRGSGLKAPFSDEMILLYDKPENHNSLSVRNVILYKTNPSVKRIPEEEFKELIAKDNKNRIQMGIKEELEVID